MTLPFDCPADHILNLPSWFSNDMPIAFREAGFLTDPRLSPAIKSSWVRLRTPPMTSNEARRLLQPYEDSRVIELAVGKDRFCGFEEAAQASVFTRLAPQLVSYSRHFCYEDGFKVGPGGIPFYSPCCHGAPGRHFPCVWLHPAPKFYAQAEVQRWPELLLGLCPIPLARPHITAHPNPSALRVCRRRLLSVPTVRTPPWFSWR